MRKITMEEVGKHTTRDDLWIVINKEVLDVTKFLKDHPGGANALLNMAGKDASNAFGKVGHSKTAKDMLKKFQIGELA